MAKRVTTADFIERAKVIHGERYDYSLADYQGIHNYVIIICNKHGSFQQSPSNHYQGKGCADCGGSKPHTTESFVEEAKAIHSDRYDYSEVEYNSNKTHVTINCLDHGPFSQIAAVHLRGNGCPVCGGNLKHSTESFIKKARSLHGHNYDYSQVDYNGAHLQVKIICPVHGPFMQSPSNHFAGKGCVECGRIAASDARRKTTEQFIFKAKSIHHDRYDYSLVEYVGSAAKVNIICSEHGPFEQTPSEHLVGSGCNKCGIIARAESRRKTTEQFIHQANSAHGNRYNYSLVEYLSSIDKVTIICPEHGTFEQSSNGHLGGKGCYECGIVSSSDAKRSTINEFIAKSRMVHGERYDYSLVEYVRNNQNVKIICPEHGTFLQTPNVHIDNKSGCPNCSPTGFSPSKPGLLYYIAITTDEGVIRYKIGITNFSVEERFHGSDLARIRVVKTWRFAIGREAAENESQILKQFAGDLYCGPKLLIGGGNGELFTHDVLGLDGADHLQGQSVVDANGKLIPRVHQSRFDF